MCRWLAYSGSPLLLKEALYGPANSLIQQSLHSRLGAETTNGDGFGVGWYGAPPTPGVFHSIEPAWNDKNLHELADHIGSSDFFAHIRAAIVRPSALTSLLEPGDWASSRLFCSPATICSSSPRAPSHAVRRSSGWLAAMAHRHSLRRLPIGAISPTSVSPRALETISLWT